MAPETTGQDRTETDNMGHDERQPEGNGLVERFAEDLRELRLAAGKPTYEKLGRLAGCSKSTVHEALTGTRLPSLDITLGLVRALGANEQQWRERWTATRRSLDESQPLAAAGPVDETERPETYAAIGSPPSEPSTRSRATDANQRHRIKDARRIRRWWVIAVLGVVIATVLTVGVTMGAPWCNEDQYVVSAEDLWRRDENGKPLVKDLFEGDTVVVKRQHPTDKKYWYVEAANGRAGWVNKHYLKQSCG